MAPLGSCQDCSPAGALHQSQRKPSGFSWWSMASWNVRTLLDVESSIDTTWRAGNVSVLDERKVDQAVSELDRH